MLRIVVEDDTCADESDARDHSLDHARNGVGARLRHRLHDHDNNGASQADQRECAQAGRFAVEIAIDSEDCADQDRAAEPSRKFDPLRIRHGLAPKCTSKRDVLIAQELDQR